VSALPPFLAPIFTRVGGLLKVVGFPGAGLAETMFDSSDIITASAAAAAAAAAAQATANLSLERATQDTFMVFGDEFVYTVGTPTNGLADTIPYQVSTFTTTNLAAAKTYVQMRAGTWTVSFWTAKRPDAANLTMKIDGVSVVTQLNLYQASANYLYKHTVTGVVVGNDPVKDITIQADGRTNPSSSFVMAVQKIWGYRTGD